jgi:hypothetical protein
MTVVTVKNLFNGMYQVRLKGGDDFESIIESLKEIIPSLHRTYDPDARAWKIYERHYLDEWLRVLEYFGDDVRIEWTSAKRQYQPPPRQPRQDQRAEAFEVLHLRETAPPELVKCAQRTLALLHHPDRGGDLLTMQAINNAADIILKV